MTSRDRAQLFQMQDEIQKEAGSRVNSKFRDNNGNVRNKLFPVRRKNEETQSVNSANRGNLLQIVKPNILSQDSDRKTYFEESNENKFLRNINSSETKTNMRSLEERFSENNSTASLSRNDDVLIKELESKGNNINVGWGSESKEDDSISVQGQKSDVTKFQTITPPNITNQIYSLPGTNSNDANSDQNQLQNNRVSTFETQRQNSSNIIYPNTDSISAATIFLPTAPPFSITDHKIEEQKFEPTPASSSSGEPTIIEAIFQQVDGLDQNTEAEVKWINLKNDPYSAFVGRIFVKWFIIKYCTLRIYWLKHNWFQDPSSNLQDQREEGRKFVPNNIFDVIDHVRDDENGSQSGVLTEGEQATKPSDIKTTTVKSAQIEERDIMGTMCDQYEEMKDKIRCKVIACFRDNKLCFKWNIWHHLWSKFDQFLLSVFSSAPGINLPKMMQ